MSDYDKKRKVEEESRKVYIVKGDELAKIIKPLRYATYACDVGWGSIKHTLERYAEDYGSVDLNPDFQRGHVWTEAQQVHYIENALRGVVAQSAFVIQLNCPNWESDAYHGDLPHGFQCIDGLQRLTAVQKFLDKKIKPFGLTPDDLLQSRFSIKSVSYRFRLEIFNFQSKADLLKHYLDLNTGGTPHSQEEIQRVRDMLERST